jgi:parallel beta-helix repeat protein
MSYRKRFVEWCQQPSRIKIRTYNPRNFIVLITAFIILASSGGLMVQRVMIPPPPVTYFIPEFFETLTITTNTTLTRDYVNTTIVIAADGVTLDGDGHMIIGPGSYFLGDLVLDPNDPEHSTVPWEEFNKTVGIFLEGRTGVTIKNCSVTGFSVGIFLTGSEGNTLQGNTANDNTNGFKLMEKSDGNTLLGNTADNNGGGFYLEESDGNTLNGNTANDGGTGFMLLWSNGNSLEANTANDNEVFGFYIDESSQNSFEGNTANNNDHFGFWSIDTSNDIFLDNTANDNPRGFHFSDSFGNILQGNTANNNEEGSGLERSDGNSLEANTATNNTHTGFHILFSSSNNTLTGNTASHNECGICYGTTDESSPNNRIYHNNFVNNLQHVNIQNTVNTWDDGYPSGGNYWSDYTGVDVDGDGIGETPYVIDENNMDRFPLMTPI